MEKLEWVAFFKYKIYSKSSFRREMRPSGIGIGTQKSHYKISRLKSDTSTLWKLSQ